MTSVNEGAENTSETKSKSGLLNTSERFTRGELLYSTRTSEGYEALDKKNSQEVLLWELRFPFTVESKEAAQCVKRLRAIQQIKFRRPRIRAFGVDSRGVFYMCTEKVKGQSLLKASEPLSTQQRLEHFHEALKFIFVIHKGGEYLGNICEDSFLLSDEQRIYLMTLMGSFDSGASRTATLPPKHTLNYYAPEQRHGGGADAISDIYALGVYGYRLFTGRYFHGDKTSPENGEDNIADVPAPSSIEESIPQWIDGILGRCLRANPADRFGSINELLRLYEIGLKSGSISKESGGWARKTFVVEHDAEMFADDEEPMSHDDTEEALGDELYEDEYERSTGRSLSLLAGVIVFIAILGGVLFVVLGEQSDFSLMAGTSAPDGNSIAMGSDVPADDPLGFPKELRLLMNSVRASEKSMTDRLQALQSIASHDDPVVKSVLVSLSTEIASPGLSNRIEEVLLQRLNDEGFPFSVKIIQDWIHSMRSIKKEPSAQAIYSALFAAVDTSRPIKERQKLLFSSYSLQPKVVLRLTAALALDQLDGQFIPLLKNFLSGEMSSQELEERGLGALLLSHPDLLVFIDKDIGKMVKLFSDDDLRWSLLNSGHIHVKHLPKLAEEVVSRRLLSPYKSIFIEALFETFKVNTSWRVQQALIRAALDNVSMQHVKEIGRWNSLQLERVLLAICVVAKEREVAVRAFDTLAAQTLRTEPANALVRWVKSRFWDYRKRVVRGVAILGLMDIASEKDLDAAFDDLMPLAAGGLFKVMVDTENTYLIYQAIDRLSEITKSKELLALLKHKDRTIRMAAVKALKGRNELAVLQGILAAFKRESDPEVKEVFKEYHWVTRDRNAKDKRFER